MKNPAAAGVKAQTQRAFIWRSEFVV